MSNRIDMIVTGLVSPGGVEYIRVAIGSDEGLVAKRTLASSEQEARAVLGAQNVFIGPYWRDFVREAVELNRYEPAAIADRVGWNGESFVLPSGELLSPDGTVSKAMLFRAEPGSIEVKGSLRGWKKKVATPLQGQSLPITLIAASCAAPLLQFIKPKFNPALCMTGRNGLGKSDLLEIVASFTGETSIESFYTTTNGMERPMMARNGMPLIIDELGLLEGGNSQARGSVRKQGSFQLAGGRTKRRMGADPEQSYYVTLTATNESTDRLLINENLGTRGAVLDRMLTLDIKDSRPYRTLDSLPEGYENAGDFVDQLKKAAGRHRGHAFRSLVAGIARDLSKDPRGTIERVDTNSKYWAQKVGVDRSNGAYRRVGGIFGLFYAGGLEGKRHEVLPSTWEIGRAVQLVYHELYGAPKPTIPIDDAIRALLARPGVRDLDKQKLRKLSDEDLDATPGFFKRKRDGSAEFCLPPAGVPRSLPDLAARIGSSKAGAELVPGDRGHTTLKRQVRTGKPDRMVVLRLPADFK